MTDRLRLLHFAALQLDTAFPWAPPRIAAARRRALRQALRNIVERAKTHEVDALTCAGDLYDQDLWTAETAATLRDAFATLAPIPVLLAPGARDPQVPAGLYRNTRWSSNVHVFAEPGFTPYRIPGKPFVIWGAATTGDHQTHPLSRASAALTPLDAVHIALFHGAAPFRPGQLERHGFVHALTGGRTGAHAAELTPLVTDPGSPEPLNFSEVQGKTEHAEGPVLLEFTALGGLAGAERLPVAATTLPTLEVDLEGVQTTAEARARIAAAVADHPHDGLARIVVRGTIAPAVALDRRQAESAAREAGLDFAAVDLGAVTVAYDLETLAGERTVRGRFVQRVLESGAGDRVLVAGLRALEGRRDLLTS